MKLDVSTKKNKTQNLNSEEISTQIDSQDPLVYDFDSLRSTILIEMFCHGDEHAELIDRISEPTKQVLEKFKKEMLSNEGYYDLEQTLNSAHQANDHFDYFITYEQDKLFSIAVIGFLQTLKLSIDKYYESSDSKQIGGSNAYQEQYLARSERRKHFAKNCDKSSMRNRFFFNGLNKIENKLSSKKPAPQVVSVKLSGR